MITTTSMFQFFTVCRSVWRNDQTFKFESQADAKASAVTWGATFDAVRATEEEMMTVISRVAAKITGFAAPAHFIDEIKLLREERRDEAEQRRIPEAPPDEANVEKVNAMLDSFWLAMSNGDRHAMERQMRLEDAKKRCELKRRELITALKVEDSNAHAAEEEE